MSSTTADRPEDAGGPPSPSPAGADTPCGEPPTGVEDGGERPAGAAPVASPRLPARRSREDRADPEEHGPGEPARAWNDGLIARRALSRAAARSGPAAAGETGERSAPPPPRDERATAPEGPTGGGLGTAAAVTGLAGDGPSAVIPVPESPLSPPRDGDRRKEPPTPRHSPGVPGASHSPGVAGVSHSPGGAGWTDGEGVRPTDCSGARAPGTGPLWTPGTAPTVASPYGGARRLEFGAALRGRLEALRRLVGLSRVRLAPETLAEAGRVLDEAAARHRLSLDHTVVAVAGAGGSGKSTLFNALAGAPLSETGVRRPTTSAPMACTWSQGADGLLDRLGVPHRLRRQAQLCSDPGLSGLVLVDLPDHDSAVGGHREQVDQLIGLADAVIWVVDPEKYADAVLHERYLRPLAGYAEVTFVVLNQLDRLPGDSAAQVLEDLRRLLDDDGLALGEHGEPGAAVLAVSALTGEGMAELREQLGRFCEERGAAERRLTADVAGAAERLRPVYLSKGRTVLTEGTREVFEERLAEAIGAQAAGRAARREWLRLAELAYGGPWWRLRRRYRRRRAAAGVTVRPAPGRPRARRPGVLSTGLYRPRFRPTPRAAGRAPLPAEQDEGRAPRADRAMVEQAVRAVAEDASAGLPEPWARAVRESAAQGAEWLPETLEETAAAQLVGDGQLSRPRWWTLAAVTQVLLLAAQLAAAAWLVAVVAGPTGGLGEAVRAPLLMLGAAAVSGPLLAWCCRRASRQPAREHGREVERRLRSTAGSCGRSCVLEPVAAELLRYREVREQYLTVAADAP
ncbi:YfjP family GTPase [Streptomyces sp. TP-A0874]|uniref:YfjP family GTPase n=1 Tax=Streptomyces sp. TP-A0874 TaxID=549819 RepID=UPI001FCD675A|nr:YfjP family GTPase [Streptomyces sp. TP-A0874]